MADLPGGAEWLTDLEANYDERDRPWAVHEGHMIAVSDRDRNVVAAGGPGAPAERWTGDGGERPRTCGRHGAVGGGVSRAGLRSHRPRRGARAGVVRRRRAAVTCSKQNLMEIGYTPEQEAMRLELRAYYEKLLDEQTVAELAASHAIGEAPRRVWKQMCADGWAGIGWPKEYGGKGATAIEQFIFFDESMRAGAPVPMLTINTVGPTIMRFGTDEQKEFFLPKILSGDLHFCIGYSEPGAGTDLASLQDARGARR